MGVAAAAAVSGGGDALAGVGTGYPRAGEGAGERRGAYVWSEAREVSAGEMNAARGRDGAAATRKWGGSRTAGTGTTRHMWSTILT